jgi:hypothetical protein
MNYMLLSLLSSVVSMNPRVRIPSRLFPHLTLTADRYCSPAATLRSDTQMAATGVAPAVPVLRVCHTG